MSRNKGGNITMAQILASSMLLSNDLGFGRRQHVDLSHIDPPNPKRDDYIRWDCGGEPGKLRRAKQIARMPERERIRQGIEL